MEREQMLKDAIAKCFKAREQITVANVKAKVPVDFFYDYEAKAHLTDAEVFAEIQASFATTPKPADMVTVTPDGRPLAPAVVLVEQELGGGDADDDDADCLRNEWPPEPAAVPVEAAPVAEESIAEHVPSKPGLSPQARLDAAHKRLQALQGERPVLIGLQRQARTDLATAVRTHQDGFPKMSHEQLARDFIAASNAERAARARGEAWATRPENKPRGKVAYVDLERMYSQGGNADTFARRMARTGNRRGAYSKQSLGMTNRDPSRGPSAPGSTNNCRRGRGPNARRVGRLTPFGSVRRAEVALLMGRPLFGSRHH